MHETKEAHKARCIRGWIGEQGTQYLMKYGWKEGKWENHKTVKERFKASIWPKGRNQRNKYRS